MEKRSRLRLILASMMCGMVVFAVALLYCSPACCEEGETIQTQKRSTTSTVKKQVRSQQGQDEGVMLYINDGEGPGGDMPSPGTQQMRPSAPAQTMRPSAPAQQMRPSAPAQTMRPSAPAQQMRPSGPAM